MYYNIFDSHIHSENSPDAEHSVSFIAETAVSKGVQGICFTDHCEGDGFDHFSYGARVKHSMLDTAMAREAFGSRLIISFGIELAETYIARDKLEDLLKHHRFDFIIGSVHKLSFEDFEFFSADYSKISKQKLDLYIRKYFEELIDRIKWGNLDIVGHLSLFVRYPKVYNGITVDLARYKEEIDEVLKLAIQNGKGIEINTSGLRNAVNDTMPDLWTIKRYRELGGEIVTIGSDAHRAEDVGAGVEHGMQMLADAGFKYFAFYRNREPVMLRII